MAAAQTTDPLANLAQAVMRGVARTGAIRNTGGTDDNVARAVEVMRAEIKALLFADRYADARDCVARGSIGQGYVVGMVVAECAAHLNKKEA